MTPLRALVWLLLCVLSFKAQADMIDTSGLQPWESCALCHGVDGVSRMSKFPKLANQPYGYLIKQLEDFRLNRRTNDGGMMASNAELLTSKSLHAVARYFSTLPPPQPVQNQMNALGKAIYRHGKPAANVQACEFCHGGKPPTGRAYPRLEGQHAAYIVKQLKDFRRKARSNDSEQVMQRIAGQLSETEILAIADFVAGLSRE